MREPTAQRVRHRQALPGVMLEIQDRSMAAIAGQSLGLVLALVLGQSVEFVQRPDRSAEAVDSPARSEAEREATTELSRFSTGEFHLETSPGRTIEAVLRVRFRVPGIRVQEWILQAPAALDTPGQRGVGAELVVAGQSLDQAPPSSAPTRLRLLTGRVPVRSPEFLQECELTVQYKAQLIARRLTAGAAGESQPAAMILTPIERQAYTRASTHYDFRSPEFQRWLKQNDLRRHENERDLALAYRVFRHIASTYRYEYLANQDRRASRLCRGDRTDCGGLAMLWTSAMRAGGVPARVLFGRWAESGKNPTDDIGTAHAKAECFIAGVGWVPVDLSSALSDRRRGDRYFGQDPGDFLALHIDPDLSVDAGPFGRKSIPWLQGALHWVVGQGTSTSRAQTVTWKVSTSKE